MIYLDYLTISMTNQDAEKFLQSMFKLGRVMLKSSHPLKEVELTPLQLHTLGVIKSHTTPTMSQIAEEMNITLPTTTTLIDRLAESGVVTRIADKEDRRVTRIKLTPKGTRLLKLLFEQQAEHINKMFEVLPQEDVDHLQRIMNQVLLKMEEKNEKVA